MTGNRGSTASSFRGRTASPKSHEIVEAYFWGAIITPWALLGEASRRRAQGCNSSCIEEWVGMAMRAPGGAKNWQIWQRHIHIIHFQRIPWPHQIERFWKLSFQSLSNIAGSGRSRISWYQSSMPIDQSNLSVYSQSPMNQQTNGCHCSTFGESAGKQLSQRTISAEHILFQEFLPRFWQTCSTCDREP